MSRSGESKKRFTSYLTVESIEALRHLSDTMRISQAALVEEAIIDLLLKYYGKARNYQK